MEVGGQCGCSEIEGEVCKNVYLDEIQMSIPKFEFSKSDQKNQKICN